MKKEKIIYLPVGILTGLTVASGAALTGAPVHAEWTNCTTTDGVTYCSDSATGMKQATTSANASVTVSAACSFLNADDTEKALTVVPGNYYYDGNTPELGNFSTLEAVCNNNSGLAIYAVGASTEVAATRNMMIGQTSGQNIATGTATQGDNSAWAMKLTAVDGGASGYTPTIETSPNDFRVYTQVPNTYTKVATFPSATSNTVGAKVNTSYAIYVSRLQAADTYIGKVKYTVVNPSTAGAPTE